MNSTTINPQEISHVLYSRGYLFDEFDYFDSLKKISKMMRKTEIQVQEQVLSCRTQRLKSSSDLNKLKSLENKLKTLGLDVYIDAH